MMTCHGSIPRRYAWQMPKALHFLFDMVPLIDAVFIVEGVRYGVPVKLECDSLNEAIACAFWATCDNTFSPKRVVNAAREVVLDYRALCVRMDSYDPVSDIATATEES
jgi:hypothetical protein